MKALLWQGHSIETADEVADVAVEFARLVAGYNRLERIDVPAQVGGQPAEASLVVGAGMGLGMLTLPAVADVDLPGAADTVAELRDRIARLRATPGGATFRLPEDFTVLDHDIGA